MSSTMLTVWLAIAVSIMLGMDILDAVVKYRNNKAEERIRQAEEEMAKAYKPPTIHTVHHDTITINVKGIIPREVALMHDDNFVSEEICEKLATEIMAKNLVKLQTFRRFEDGVLHYEATLRVVDPKGGFDDDL